ncbi:uncharacterized protein ACDP82_018052 [Pangshura tecta]
MNCPPGGVPQYSTVTALKSIFNSTACQPGTQETATPLLKPWELFSFHFLFDQHGELTSTADHGDSRPQTYSMLECTGGGGSYCCVGRRVCAGRAPIQQRNADIYAKIARDMRDKGCTRDRQQSCVNIKELWQAYQETREANSRSGSVPQTCCFYEMLHAMLSGDPTTTPKGSMDTSQEPRAISSNNKEDIVDEEENVRQANGGSILPDSQELFLTLDHIPSEDQLVLERDTREGTSTETLSVGASSTLGQRLSQIRRQKKKTWEDMFNELMHVSESDKMVLRAWRITLSENLDVDRDDRRACREQERAMQKRCCGL